MALAEASAAWQRTANRCLVQEDAKRAPKIARGSSIPPFAKQPDSEPSTVPGGVDIPTSGSEPLDQSPYSNSSPNSRWWLHSKDSDNVNENAIKRVYRSPKIAKTGLNSIARFPH